MTAEQRLTLIKKAVEAQANDETLWAEAPYIGEAYMQQSLRWLHRVIEDPPEHAERVLGWIENQRDGKD